MVTAGFLPQTYLYEALKGGQDSTRDLELAPAKKLKHQKLALPDTQMDIPPIKINSLSG